MTSPNFDGARCGTISTGRPLSNSASSSVASAIDASFSRLLDHYQVKHPPDQTDNRVLPAILLAPGCARTNQLFLNPIVNYHFGDGWLVGSSPEITTNWIASGGKWTVPVGGGFGKLFRVDGQAVRVDLDSYYNAVRPQASNETWLVQLKLTFVFPDSSAVNSEGSEQ